MTIQEVIDFIKIEREQLKARFGAYDDEQKAALSSTVKLMEEVGELSDEILKHNGRQRQDKIDAKGADEDNLAKEFADVILSTTMLAVEMNIDLEAALKLKMDKIDQRYSAKD
ncbi:MAG: MazG nucleotide pyrophosphohydrolase domain-containing protein [bacterium]